MEQELMKLMARFGLLAVMVYVAAAAMGKQHKMKLKPAPVDQRMNPTSPVWNRGNGAVAPLATTLPMRAGY